MTPEQNEQWQRAVMRAYPVPIPEGKEGTLAQWLEHRRAEAAVASLLPEEERFEFLDSKIDTSLEHLADWQLPDWVRAIRKHSAFQSIGLREAEFAFRCDVALIGMQVLNPTPEAREESYQKLLISYLPRALRPLVERTETNNDTELRHDFEGYHQICLLCESDGLYWDQERWLDIQRNFGPDRPLMTYKTYAHVLVEAFVLLARRVLFHVDEPDADDDIHAPMSAHSLMFYFPFEFRAVELYRYFVGQPFLDVMEAEYPPPEWLEIS